MQATNLSHQSPARTSGMPHYDRSTTDGPRANHSSSYGYDANGNMTQLLRRGPVRRNESGGLDYGIIDNMQYEYNGNQVVSIDEYASDVILAGSTDFCDYNSSGKDYFYDRNGNMIEDRNKTIMVSYNHLNKPFNIISMRGDKADYVWDAMGRKRSVIYEINDMESRKPDTEMTTPPSTTLLWYDYCGQHVYKNGSLERTILPTGFFMDGKVYTSVTDHLGNIRGLVCQGNSMNETRYYPYGMPHYDCSAADRYKFGGKELEVEGVLNLYDFEARMYDPALTRFMSPDPLADRYPSVSPYAYCANNPLRFTDPSGMRIVVDCDDENEKNNYEASIKRMKEDSELFAWFYSQLEDSSTDIHVRWGETVWDDSAQDYVPGAYFPSNNNIVYLYRGNLNNAVIIEENYHAYQYLFGDNDPLWNREFEAKVITSLVLSKTEGGFQEFPGMKIFSNNLYYNSSWYFDPYTGKMNQLFIYDYCRYGMEFRNFYFNRENYNVPVYTIPQNISNLNFKPRYE